MVVKKLMNDLRYYNQKVIDMQQTIIDTTNSIKDTNVIEYYLAHLSEHIQDQSTNTPSTSRNNNRPTSKIKSKQHQTKHRKKSFILPPPNVNEDMYSPMQAILFVINNTCKEKKLILNLPKVDGKYVVRKMSPLVIITALIKKNYSDHRLTNVYHDSCI